MQSHADSASSQPRNEKASSLREAILQAFGRWVNRQRLSPTAMEKVAGEVVVRGTLEDDAISSSSRSDHSWRLV
jgi:hypothetical protein